MEILTRKIRHLTTGLPVGDQMQIDDDYNVPDNRPDVAEIVHSAGRVRIEKMEKTENHVSVTGRMHFAVLYLPAEGERRLESLRGEIPFEETVYVGERTETFHARTTEPELRVTAINSRKLSVRALVGLTLLAQEDTQEELPYGVEAEENVCMKQSARRILHLVENRRDQFRIKEELELPATKETIAEILWQEAQLTEVETRLTEDGLSVRGAVVVFCLYRSEDGRLDWTEQSRPFEGKLSLGEADAEANGIPRVDYLLADTELEARQDADGEMRILGFEGTVELTVRMYEEKEETVLEDLYLPGRRTTVRQEERTFDELLLRNRARCKVSERIQIPELKDEILQICHSGGEVRVEHTQMETDGLHVEGILDLTVLYLRPDEGAPLGVWKGATPFFAVVGIQEGGDGAIYELTAAPEQIAVGLFGGDEVEVKASVSLDCFFVKRNVVRVIEEAQGEELSREERLMAPGIVGCIVRGGESLWDIAKKYQTSPESIVKANHLQEETVKPGDRLLIFKETSYILDV